MALFDGQTCNFFICLEVFFVCLFICFWLNDWLLRSQLATIVYDITFTSSLIWDNPPVRCECWPKGRDVATTCTECPPFGTHTPALSVLLCPSLCGRPVALIDFLALWRVGGRSEVGEYILSASSLQVIAAGRLAVWPQTAAPVSQPSPNHSNCSLLLLLQAHLGPCY